MSKHFDSTQADFKTFILSKRWKHHTKSGGYDRLAQEFKETSTIIQAPNNRLLPSYFEKRVFPRLLPSSRDVNHYRFPDFLTELRIFKQSFNVNAGIVHSLYAEDQLNLLLTYRNKLPIALTGTFHLPTESRFISRISKLGAMSRFLNLDSAIVVSTSMISFYENWVGKNKVFFVPHGIDVSAFKPKINKNEHAFSEKKNLKVLIVGGHGRDWDMIKKVASIHSKSKLNIEYSVVAPRKIASDLGTKFKTYTGISEYELINLYSESDILFIPVNFATANNSLLESLACGTPVVSTNTGGIPDYLDDSCGWLLPKGDIRAATELLTELSENPHKIRDKQKPARKKSLNYDWSKVASQIKDVHKETIERLSSCS